MAKITWLGEDRLHNGAAGPSFTTWRGTKFPKGEPVEVADEETLRKAKGNPFFEVEERRKPGPKPKGEGDGQDAG